MYYSFIYFVKDPTTMSYKNNGRKGFEKNKNKTTLGYLGNAKS